jgi:YD repeat-containing protein
VTGYTESAGSFPIVEAVQSTHGGEQDAFIAKLMTPVIHRRSAWTQSCPLCSLYETQHNVAGPINSATGNYMYQKIDEMMPAPGGSLTLQRSYISEARDLYTRTLGYGWTHNHEIRLVFPGDPGGVTGQVQLQAPGGSQLPFFDLGNGSYEAYPGVTAQMTRIMATGGITTYVVTATNQTVYTFNAAGLVTQTVNPMGNVISYTYYVSGPLQAVQSYGRSLQFTYDAQNRLKQVIDPISRSTQFGYDANGDLAIVTDTRGLTWTYQYSGTTHLLTRIVDPNQKTVERTEYDGQGRAIKQYNGKDEVVAQLQFGSGGIITVTDGLMHTSIDRYGRGAWHGAGASAKSPRVAGYT